MGEKKRNGRWLGCAAGFLLDAARAGGFDACGVDQTPHTVAEARRRGHRITLGTVDDLVRGAGLQKRTFDVVTALDVIEHVPDPGLFLQQLVDLATGNRRPQRQLHPLVDHEHLFSFRRLAADEMLSVIQHIQAIVPQFQHEHNLDCDILSQSGAMTVAALQMTRCSRYPMRSRGLFDVHASTEKLRAIPFQTFAPRTNRDATARKAAMIAEHGIVKVSPLPDIPVSFQQERFWFLEQFDAGTTVHNSTLKLELRGTVNLPALQAALQELVHRHETLRIRYILKDQGLFQEVLADSTVDLPTIDLRHLGRSAPTEAHRLLLEESGRSFHLDTGPLYRAQIIRLGEETYWLLLTFHVSAVDSMSHRIVVNELLTHYKTLTSGQPSFLPALPMQYADYAIWQRRTYCGETLQPQIDYWKRQMAGAPALLELPTDYSRPSKQCFLTASQSVRIPISVVETLEQLGRAEGCSLFTTMLTAFQILLSRYSRQEDLVVGTTFPGRILPELADLIGCFENPIALRLDASGDPSFRALLQRSRRVVAEAQANQDVRFAKLLEEWHVERDLSHAPVFQVEFHLRESPSSLQVLPRLSVTRIQSESIAPQFDLALFLFEDERILRGNLEYRTDLFAPATIERMADNLEVLLERIAQEPDRAIGELPLLTNSERRKVLWDWNRTATEFPEHLGIHDLFEEQARRTPDAPALAFQGQQVSYAELNRRADRLANRLLRLGVRQEVRVGVFLERTPELVVSLLAILKAGGAYVPLDLSYPSDRIAYMLQDCQAAFVLTDDRLVGSLPPHDATIVCVNDQACCEEEIAAQPPLLRVAPTSLAYVIYTSGSTGLPKGVAIEHRNTVNFIAWARRAFSSEDLRCVLASTSISFDLSVFELFVTLSAGGCVALVNNVLDLQSSSDDAGITLINTVPSAMAELIRLKAVPSSVLTVNLAGEALPTELVNAIYDETQVRRVYDLYGPSETTTYSTWTLREREARPSIGRPIANTTICIMDSRRQPVPIGVPGEVYIGGHGVARGYLNRPELTTERFVDHLAPDFGPMRFYRTGDLARWSSDGSLEYLGRMDRQVKLRGFRIELGEIESVLRNCSEVAQAIAVIREDQPGDRRLVAYVALHDSQTERSVSALRDVLRRKLPEYMQPAAIVVLDSFPMTLNGKVDRKLLPPPEPVQAIRSLEYVEPRDAIESELARIWCSLLGLDRAGIHDSFFQLGGHSLLAARLFAILQERFHLKLEMKSLFEGPTISELADNLKRNSSQLSRRLPIENQPVDHVSQHGRDDTRRRSAPNLNNCASDREYLEMHREGAGSPPVIFVGDKRLIPVVMRRLSPKVPIYSLKLDGTHFWPPKYLSVYEQRDVFVADLLRHQIRGTVFLVGYSYGGLLAYMLASTLNRIDGRETNVLMIEPELPMQYWSASERIQHCLQQINQGGRSILRQLWLTLHPLKQQMAHAEKQRRERLAHDDGMLRWQLMESYYVDMSRKARIQASTLRGALVGTRHYHQSQAKSWEKICLGGVDRYILPIDDDDHQACFRDPYIGNFLTYLDEWYNGATIPEVTANPGLACTQRERALWAISTE